MSRPLNIILPTIRFLPLTKDIIVSLIGIAENSDDIHLTIADGQGCPLKQAWIAEQIGEDEHGSPRGCHGP